MTDAGELSDALVRLGCALAAGGAFGWERELQDKPAGLRTNMLVALSSALLMLVGVRLVDSAAASQDPRFAVDLTRIIQGIVGGIGFLGAGTIIQSRHSVHGLTTASTIWLSAAVGISSGMGYFALTAATVVLGLVVLVAFGLMERHLLSRRDKPPE
jgi:putative Mg2+ transporter-C (MgtC) family protein